MNITLTPTGRKDSVLIVQRVGDRETYRNTVNPDAMRSRVKVARALDMTEIELAEHFAKVRTSGEPVIIERPDEVKTPTGPFNVTMRGLRNAVGSALMFTHDDPLIALQSALVKLDSPSAEPVIHWQNAERLAALDVDCHDRPFDKRPEPWQLLNIVASLQPAPALFWVTHGRGLRLVFTSAGKFTANELAACAALGVKQADPTLTFEIKTETRHPSYPNAAGLVAGEVFSQGQTNDIGAVAAWIRRDVSDEQLESWLEEHNYQRGQAYPHDFCPVRPGVSSHEKPVYVGDYGFVCLKCGSDGIKLGSKKPGFFPYAALMPGGVPTVIRDMAENFCHWEHASFVLDDRLNLRGPVAELTYRSLLKVLHCREIDDPRVALAFSAGQNLIRLENHWTSADASTSYSNNIAEILAKLPACQFLKQDEATGVIELCVDRERVRRFQERVDIRCYGYPTIVPIRGVRVYSQFLDFDDEQRISAVVLSKELRSPALEQFRPRYLPPSQRMSIEEARKRYELVFPGINWNYLLLLIAAKGCSEGRVGMPPLIAVSGYTGAAKSSTVAIAASTLGDRNTEVIWNPSDERFRQSIIEGSFSGSFVTCNEIIKDGAKHRKGPRECLNPFLNLTPNSVSHKLYVGPVQMGQLPVFVVTEVHLPNELRESIQIARRFIHVRLNKRLFWEKSLVETGVYSADRFRLARLDFAEAANAVLSFAIDRWFRHPATLKEIAADLGFSTLEQAAPEDENENTLKRFFKAVCNAPSLDGDKTRQKFQGTGWKLIRKSEETELRELWTQLCTNEASGFIESERCRECDWAHELNFQQGEICFDLASHGGSTVAVRFRVGDPRSKTVAYNDQIQGNER